MYKFSPKRKNRIAYYLAGGCYLAFLVLFFLPVEYYRGIFQTLGLILLTAGIYITVTYMLREYLYRLDSDAENKYAFEFTVTVIQGRRQTVACRISSSEIKSVEKYSRKKLAGKKKVKLYNYCVDICPDAYILWLENDPLHDGDGCESGVLIMPDEQMMEIIKRVVLCKG